MKGVLVTVSLLCELPKIKGFVHKLLYEVRDKLQFRCHDHPSVRSLFIRKKYSCLLLLLFVGRKKYSGVNHFETITPFSYKYS